MVPLPVTSILYISWNQLNFFVLWFCNIILCKVWKYKRAYKQNWNCTNLSWKVSSMLTYGIWPKSLQPQIQLPISRVRLQGKKVVDVRENSSVDKSMNRNILAPGFRSNLWLSQYLKSHHAPIEMWEAGTLLFTPKDTSEGWMNSFEWPLLIFCINRLPWGQNKAGQCLVIRLWITSIAIFLPCTVKFLFLSLEVLYLRRMKEINKYIYRT